MRPTSVRGPPAATPTRSSLPLVPSVCSKRRLMCLLCNPNRDSLRAAHAPRTLKWARNQPEFAGHCSLVAARWLLLVAGCFPNGLRVVSTSGQRQALGKLEGAPNQQDEAAEERKEVK